MPRRAYFFPFNIFMNFLVTYIVKTLESLYIQILPSARLPRIHFLQPRNIANSRRNPD